MSLEAGSNSVLLQKNIGSPGAVQNQLVYHSPIDGAKLTAPLLGSILIEVGDGAAEVFRSASVADRRRSSKFLVFPV